jgi:hypothetical protein
MAAGMDRVDGDEVRDDEKPEGDQIVIPELFGQIVHGVGDANPEQSCREAAHDNTSLMTVPGKDEISGLDSLIGERFAEHRQAEVMLSMPGFGRLLSAEFLGATGGDMSVFESVDRLAGVAG